MRTVGLGRHLAITRGEPEENATDLETISINEIVQGQLADGANAGSWACAADFWGSRGGCGRVSVFQRAIAVEAGAIAGRCGSPRGTHYDLFSDCHLPAAECWFVAGLLVVLSFSALSFFINKNSLLITRAHGIP
jgi:hypothetical protein